MTVTDTKREPTGPVATASDGRRPHPAASWDHSVGIRLFRSGRCEERVDALPPLDDVDDVAGLPGYVLQAARTLAGLSQQDLRDASTVSKKVINDFENGFVRPKTALVERLAAALRDRGVRFVRGEDTVGVVVVLTRARVEANSRSPARSAGAAASATRSPARAGRPRASAAAAARQMVEPAVTGPAPRRRPRGPGSSG